LLDFTLADDGARSQSLRASANGTAESMPAAGAAADAGAVPGVMPETDDLPSVIDFLRDEGLMAVAPAQPVQAEPYDVTRTPASSPMPRSGRLQVLARGEAGAMLMFAYSSMRGFGGVGHGSLAVLRAGELPVRITHPLTGRPVTLGHIEVNEAHYISGGHGSL